MVADWQLPPGVSRGLWDYVHDPAVARRYDAQLAGTPLLEVDIAFARQHMSPGRLIDLGCGTGRLALPLATAGFQVTAVDLSAEMLAVVAEKARAAGVTVDCTQANLVDLKGFADHSFDSAACLFQTLGMICGADSRQRVLENVHRLLRPGGRFVLHVHNRWFHIWTRHGRRLLARDVIGALLGRTQPGDYLMPPHQGLGPMPMHLFTRREIRASLVRAGFTINRCDPVAIEGMLTSPGWLPTIRAYGYLLTCTSADDPNQMAQLEG